MNDLVLLVALQQRDSVIMVLAVDLVDLLQFYLEVQKHFPWKTKGPDVNATCQSSLFQNGTNQAFDEMFIKTSK